MFKHSPLRLCALGAALIPSLCLAEGSLEKALEARAEASSKSLPAPVKTTMEDALAALEASGITDQAVQVGQKAPGFSLPDVDGNFVDSAELLKQGPLVLVFYRGAWCPYCNLTVAAYADVQDEIERTGATLVAISPEAPDAAAAMAQKEGLGFPVLTDVNNAYARALGIVYEMPPDLAALYQQFNIPLEPKAGTEDTYELPLSATYVIDTDRTVRYAFLEADYKKRAEPAEVVDVLKKL